MSDKENKTLPVALLVTGIVCIMILSCCFVWLVVRCERWRRRRKYRPKSANNRYKINASSHTANGQELQEMKPRHLKPSINLIHYSSRNSVTSQSIPSLLSADSMDDSIASEPLYSRNYGGDEPDSDYLPSIARILGSFPALPYYPPSASNSTENVLTDAKNDKPPIPVARPRAGVTQAKEFSINSSLYTDRNLSKASQSQDSVRSADQGSTKSASSAESLKLEIPGGAIRIRDMLDSFDFTRLREKKVKAASSFDISSGEKREGGAGEKPVFETEV